MRTTLLRRALAGARPGPRPPAAAEAGRGGPRARGHTDRPSSFALRLWLTFGSALLLAVLLTWSAALAQGGGYSLAWWSLASGGGVATGGAYALHGSSGQADAGRLGGGAYTVRGGFWQPAVPAAPRLRTYLPLVQTGGSRSAPAALPDLVLESVRTSTTTVAVDSPANLSPLAASGVEVVLPRP